MKRFIYFLFATFLAVNITSCGGDDDENTMNGYEQEDEMASDYEHDENYVKVDCTICNATGNCWRCLGSGKYCESCEGSGNCEECNGSLICAYCNGDSSHTCDKCNGTAKCPYCGGTDKCSTCGGLGKIDYGLSSSYWIECGMCFGYGHCNKCSSGACGNCNGKGIWTCGYCKGDGTCHTCAGSGTCQRCGGDPHCYLCTNSNGKCNHCEGRGYTWEYRSHSYEDDDSDESDIGGGGNPSGGDTQKRCKYCKGEKKCYNFFSYSSSKYYCRGTRKCQWCNGKGWFSAFGDRVPCPNCYTPGRSGYNGNDVYGDGLCSYCSGTGVCSHCDGTGYEP